MAIISSGSDLCLSLSKLLSADFSCCTSPSLLIPPRKANVPGHIVRLRWLWPPSRRLSAAPSFYLQPPPFSLDQHKCTCQSAFQTVAANQSAFNWHISLPLPHTFTHTQKNARRHAGTKLYTYCHFRGHKYLIAKMFPKLKLNFQFSFPQWSW